MGHATIPGEEIERKGRELYERKIRAIVENEENIGKICAIDIETGAYHVADEPLDAARPLHEQHVGAAVWGERIGYNAVYALSGFVDIERTAK